jgi:hypothetical protein
MATMTDAQRAALVRMQEANAAKKRAAAGTASPEPPEQAADGVQGDPPNPPGTRWADEKLSETRQNSAVASEPICDMCGRSWQNCECWR